ncbi:S8 family serine peptidase [uncultured Marixanthomonas sp.]|uniref:S8 family serine peptidase n=1 Tax=uncultured Marixanthomonas sp. TaxID=757245 RepID=UPI0030DB3CCC|tara:strand:+ start:225637 stop:228546 length:2910 start_codon:yes stop_codon:yes gene_type:complete
MRKLVLSIVLLFPFVYIFSQSLDYYYVEFEEGDVPQNVQTTVNTDQTLTFSMQNTALASALNVKPIYSFEKAFPKSLNPRLLRVYLITTQDNFSISSLANRAEIDRLVLIDDFEENLLTNQNNNFSILPNDYDDVITGGRNTALDLIRAPLAWTITTGDPNINIGVVDGKVDMSHEDIQGSVVENITLGNLNGHHGTGIVGLINANTGNGKGISSIASGTKVVFIGTNGGSHQLINGLTEIIDLKNSTDPNLSYPNLKIVNCSFALYEGHFNIPYLDEVMYGDNGIVDNDILLIVSAGNQSTDTYTYPAAYDETIGVTTVGERVAPTYYHNILDPDGNLFWVRSWKDVHEFRPDTQNTSSHVHNDKINVTAPGQLLVGPTSNYSEFPTGYSLKVATSPASPFVSGLAGLILSDNPNLAASKVKQIIENTTDDIYQIPYNQPYIGQLGTGRINAYRAVLTAKCMADPNYEPNLDLMIRNSKVDYGYEPDNNTQQVFWNSQDIWVRHNSGESYIDVHENPEYSPVIPNYVNVRVTNRSCITSSGNEELKLYWSKANTALSWPDPWDGSETVGNNIPLGGEVGTLNIPPLEPGQEAVLEFEWLIPNPQDYVNLNPNPWHFCLLARIDTPNDPMTDEDTGVVVTHNVKNNNNIGWKNTTVVDVIPNPNAYSWGGVVAVSNPFSQSKNFSLELVADSTNTPNEFGERLFEEAEIGIEMDNVLFDAWERGNKTGTNFITTFNPKKVIATDTVTLIDNIQFLPNELGTVNITFNFLTKKLSNKRSYMYHLIQRDLSNGEIIGGETYEIRKKPRPAFSADAGSDEEINRSESVTLQAPEINEDAVYNWYDVEGNLIHTGNTFMVSPEFTQQYKLEVISNLDGLKDYDELEVVVNPYRIESLTPNPTTSQVTVNYMATDASSAYVMVVNQNTSDTSNYIIDTEGNSHTINLNGFAAGLYSIILVCDGEVQGSKNLLKQ